MLSCQGEKEENRKKRKLEEGFVTIGSAMANSTLSLIEKQIAAIKAELMKIGEMRPGSLTRQYRNPKDKTGPFYQLSYTQKTKSKTEYVRDHQVDDLQKQVDTYKKFKQLIDRWVELSIERSKLKRDIANRDHLK